ncbi:MAG: hypothetical protein ACR2PI_16210 [Hyphomicrobiaceae bacterium]
MKIFPPLSEMLWPPGYGTGRIVARYRYLLFGLAGFVAVIIAWPSIQAPPGATSDGRERVATAPIVVDGAKCSALLLERDTTTTVEQPCGRSFRMAAGDSITNSKALKRTSRPSRHGTLTAADRAIVSPRQVLRSTLWDQNNSPINRPSLALSPKAN